MRAKMEEELQKLTVIKLKEKLTEKGLDTKGVKAVLVKRLLEALDGEAETSEDRKDVTHDDSALATDEAVSLDDTNGKNFTSFHVAVADEFTNGRRSAKPSCMGAAKCHANMSSYRQFSTRIGAERCGSLSKTKMRRIPRDILSRPWRNPSRLFCGFVHHPRAISGKQSKAPDVVEHDEESAPQVGLFSM